MTPSLPAAPTEPRLWPGAEGPRTPSLPWPLQEGVGSTETHWGRGLSGLGVGRGWSGRGHGAWEALQEVRVGWVKEGELGTAQISLNLACRSQAWPARAPPPFQPTKGIQTRDKYLRPKIKPGPASLFRQPSCFQALIWVLIGLRLEICMFISMRDMASHWAPGLDGAPGLVGKCQVGSGGKDSGALGGGQHLLSNIGYQTRTAGRPPTWGLGCAAELGTWGQVCTPYRTPVGQARGRKGPDDANHPLTRATSPHRGDSCQDRCHR